MRRGAGGAKPGPPVTEPGVFEMILRPVGATALPLLLAAAAALPAAELADFARFAALHHEAAATLLEPSTRAVQLTGVKLEYRNEKLDATILEALLDDGTRVQELHAHTRLVLDGGFLAAPVTGAVKAFMKASETHIARAELPWDESPRAGGVLETLAIKEVALTTQDSAFSMTARSLVSIKAEGTMTWDPATKKLTVEVTGVKAAGLPVPLALAFGLMERFLQAEFVELARPHIRLDVGYFLR